MNECHFIGTLCYDPEFYTLENGTKKVVLRLAVTRSFERRDGTKGKRTAYADFEAWDSGAEMIHKHFRKGDIIVISNASMEQDTWQDEQGKTRSEIYYRINSFGFGPRNRPVESK